jgi:hypothetical protein
MSYHIKCCHSIELMKVKYGSSQDRAVLLLVMGGSGYGSRVWGPVRPTGPYSTAWQKKTTMTTKKKLVQKVWKNPLEGMFPCTQACHGLVEHIVCYRHKVQFQYCNTWNF